MSFPVDRTTVLVGEVVCEVGVNHRTVITVPEDCASVYACSVVDEFSVVYKTVFGAFVPVDGSSVGSGSVVNEV